MKFLSLFLVLSFLFVNPSLLKAGNDLNEYKLSDELVVSQLGKDIYLVTHSLPWKANSLLVRYPDNFIIWCDTPYTEGATEKVWNWIKSNKWNEKIVEINTGFHNDNLGGNGFLLRHSVNVFGTELIVRMLKERSEKTRSQLLKWLGNPEFIKYYRIHSITKYYPPNKLLKIRKNQGIFLFDGLLEVFYPGPSHSMDNLVVFFPDKKLLFGGCAVKSMKSKTLGFTGDADLSEWPVSLRKVNNRYKELLLVVPGHGKQGGSGLLDHTLSLLKGYQ